MRNLFDYLVNGPFLSILGAAIPVIYIYLIVRYARVLRRHPATITIAVLGFPKSRHLFIG